MKTIGINKSVVLTKEKAEYWISHQANQRLPIERHVNGLAKLLSRVGWRNDQRICITEDNRIINGLQRLCAIIKLGDYGWQIPVTVFKNEEMTSDLLSSFNVQKSDSMDRLMRRLYGWTDHRMVSVCLLIWSILEKKQNPTTSDLVCIYEGLRHHIDKALSVKENKRPGASAIPVNVVVAAIFCSIEGLDIKAYIEAAEQYVNENRSCPVWKELKSWNLSWRKTEGQNGEILKTEPGGHASRVSCRCKLIRDYIEGRKLTPISKMKESEINSLSNKYRELIRNMI